MRTRPLLRSLVLPVLAVVLAWLLQEAPAGAPDNLPAYIRRNYVRQDFRIPMRDGTRLYTVVYAPRDASQRYPILMRRTPYGVGPYEAGRLPGSLGPNRHFAREGYIFVEQDVRGCYMSEGKFEDMRPQLSQRGGKKDIDESTDTHDTIEWLLKHVPGHNGKVGLWGISYPGFYAASGMIDAHPALKAVSPQAPIADWFFDDFHHHGTTFLTHCFNFFIHFGQPRPEPTPYRGFAFSHGTPDGYQFFLDLGPLKNVNARYFKDRIAFWNRMVEHPNYDDFWKARNLLPHLKKVAPAVMTVGGWYDAEDLYGIFNTYQAVEKQNLGIFNILVIGPWRHGGWSSDDGSRLGNIRFGSQTSFYFQQHVELPFFNHYLKGKGKQVLPEAQVFETGVNRWRKFDRWPPRTVRKQPLYLRAGGRLAFDAPTEAAGTSDEYVSDPARPVPYTETITNSMSTAYMTDDQRFSARRPDVLVYQTDVLTRDVTLAGPLRAELVVSTSAGDADWVVKLIDVFPADADDAAGLRPGLRMGGYQMMARSEAMRGRFRNSYSKPEPFVANEPAKVAFDLQDVLHTFRKGHRIMVQISSTWFPLIDRNPQKYVPNIFLAEPGDFIKATHRVYRSKTQPTRLEVGILPPEENPGARRGASVVEPARPGPAGPDRIFGTTGQLPLTGAMRGTRKALPAFQGDR
jgi:putative CocE/NonD family hydrolase